MGRDTTDERARDVVEEEPRVAMTVREAGRLGGLARRERLDAARRREIARRAGEVSALRRARRSAKSGTPKDLPSP